MQNFREFMTWLGLNVSVLALTLCLGVQWGYLPAKVCLGCAVWAFLISKDNKGAITFSDAAMRLSLAPSLVLVIQNWQ